MTGSKFLYNLMFERLSSEELKHLCNMAGFDSDFFFENKSKSQGLSDLLQMVNRRYKRSGHLLKAIHDLRPDLQGLLINEFEQYFQSPDLEPTEVMRPPNPGELPLTGDACRNISTALSLLRLGENNGDVFDDSLSENVLQFQIDYDHESKDGFFGPGTRKHLTKVFLETHGIYPFEEWINPLDRTEYLVRIQKNLLKYFSEEELESLCFQLDIVYSDLSGSNRASKVRELTQYLERRGRIPVLIEICKEERPLVEWTKVR